jgi:hypothetical protein
MDDSPSMISQAQIPAITKSVNAGDKINGQFTVTKIEKAK